MVAPSILVVGGGYIGQAFMDHLRAPHTLVTRRECDYQNPLSAIYLMKRADIIINCAGFTGRPNIDECEARKGETAKANVGLPAMLSWMSEYCDKTFVHISSGCIYEGDNGGDGWTEEDAPTPRSFYSKTKVMAEHVVKGYVIRIRMPFGRVPHPRSFITKIGNYPRLISAPNSMTFLEDMVYCVEALLDAEAPQGIYNVVNDGTITHRRIAREMGWRDKEFIRLEELDTKAPRSNCVLDNTKASKYYQMPHILQRVREIANAY